MSDVVVAARLEKGRDSDHIIGMSKMPTKKSKTTGRKARYIGRTAEGFLIPEPDFKPLSFTVRQVRDVVRDVKRRLAEAERAE